MSGSSQREGFPLLCNEGFSLKVKVFPGDRVRLAISVLTVLAVAAVTLCAAGKVDVRNTNIGGAFAFVLLLVSGGFVCGVLFWKLIAAGLVDRLVGSILFPREYLTEVPAAVSRLRGLIRSGKHGAAMLELETLKQQYPLSAGIVLEELCLHRCLGTPDEFRLEKILAFLEQDSADPERIDVLFSGCDLLLAAGRRNEAAQLLKEELRKKSLYARSTGKKIAKRLNALKNGEAEDESY